MGIGQFDQRILIKECVKISNGRGGAAIEEKEVDEVWGRVRQISVREQLRYGAHEKDINTIIEIRYHPLLQPGKDYVAYIGNRKFEITTPIDKTQGRRFYELPGKEVF